MLRVLALQRDTGRLVLAEQNKAPVEEEMIRFPLVGQVRTFPITVARAFPLAGKQRTFP
jgi:hypothetical protein